MTPIGHTLTGLAIGYLAIPREMPRKQKWVALGVFSILASAPDLPFPYWGHNNYRISHSVVTTTIGVVVVSALALWKCRGRPPCTWGMVLAGAIAWYSHLLLDSMYSWGVGMPIMWPFGMVRLTLPVPWLHTGDHAHIFSVHNFWVAVYEILTFGPLLILSMGLKHCWPRRLQKTSEVDAAE